MHKQLIGTRQASDCRNFVARINRSELGCLRNADHARLVRVQLILTHKQRFGLANIDLAVSAPDQEQFRSAGEKFRRAAFVGLNVSVLMADDAAK